MAYGEHGANRARSWHSGVPVFGIAGLKLPHGFLEGQGAIAMALLFKILVEGFDCGDIVAFALRLRAGGLCSFDGFPPLLQIRRAWRLPDWVEVRHGYAPL